MTDSDVDREFWGAASNWVRDKEPVILKTEPVVEPTTQATVKDEEVLNTFNKHLRLAELRASYFKALERGIELENDLFLARQEIEDLKRLQCPAPENTSEKIDEMHSNESEFM